MVITITGGLVGFLSANNGRLKKALPFFVGGEDCFCTRETAAGQYGALDRKAILDADLSLMMAEGPAVVADHAFTTGKIAQSGFDAVVGGFRIVPPLTDEYIQQVIATLKEINPDYLIPGHCAGERFYDLVRVEMPEKVIRSAVGARFIVGA